MPYQSRYTLGEFWAEFTAGSLWRQYATNNPVESAAIRGHVEKKIAGEADFIPIDVAKTHVGKALVMVLITLPAA